MKNIDLEKIKKIHFIGIGGIGVSAIAKLFLSLGVKVSGSDEYSSQITKSLEKEGAKVFYKHSAENLSDDTDLVVYTVAIDRENSELVKAKKLGIKTKKYSQMLGIISDGYYTIAVSGTHGKTTTTAMIAKIAIDAGTNPTVIVGSLLKDFGSNLIIPKDSLWKKNNNNKNIFIVEACEYKKSFLDISPNILVITNIEEDHLDYYKNLDHIQNAFKELVGKLSKSDFVVCNPNDENIKPVIKNAKSKIIDYTKLGGETSKLRLKVEGEHNKQNAKIAFAVSKILKIKKEKAFEALSKFEGVWRRFEYKGKTKYGVKVYDDYAHHPTEIRTTLKTAREKFLNKKIITIFQPHLYSRTKFFLDDFAKSFKDTDEVIIAPIYSAREKEDKSINNKILANKINKNSKNGKAFDSFDNIKLYVKDNIKKDDIIITMGAGDVYKIGEDLIVGKGLSSRNRQ